MFYIEIEKIIFYNPDVNKDYKNSADRDEIKNDVILVLSDRRELPALGETFYNSLEL
jgi:hypothetical protein